jgi:ubiquitin carboxyl-terminal hydrolase 25/28
MLTRIALQRVQFNRETLQPYKSQAYVMFGETLFMDRFLDSADPEKKAYSKALQSELNDCRDRIVLLTVGKVSVVGAFTVPGSENLLSASMRHSL